MLDKEKIVFLIKEIKKKRELQAIDDNFVTGHIHKFLQHEPKTAKALQENFNRKSKAYTAVVKNVRAQLRRVYGLFRDDVKERKRLVEELLVSSKQQRAFLLHKILSTHSSTQERLPSYEELYQKIFSITGKPKTILDLGCGINPFSFSFMKLKECAYYAYDLNQEEIASLNQYFQQLHKENPSVTGKAIVADINKITFPKADICFLLKMTDVIDKGKGHKRTEELLNKIPAKYVVVSFATKTMSGKEMTAPRRSWMEWLCKRLGWEYTILEFSNEILYLVKKR
ncbi:MAG: hypothetical protein AABX31_02160 [Nanoarchaeota archaeon]